MATRKRDYKKHHAANRKQRNAFSRSYYKANREALLARKKKQRETNPDKSRDKDYRYKYGITLVQYEAMLAQQKGVCVICGHPPKIKRLHVDHDHKTGQVRGLLCYRCNRVLVGKNNIDTARKILAYLERDFDGRKIEA